MITGRKREIQLLQDAFKDNESHFIAVYGRRRIGKTFLVRESYGYRFTFQHAGVSGGNLHDELFAFSASLKEAGYECRKEPESWGEAFEDLKDLIRSSTEKKKVIFIDELSWMDTPKSRFVSVLENFWNGWASARKDIVLVVCASATSWILSNVVHNKGGLYNRITEQIHLKAFTLAECEDFVRNSQIVMTRDQMIQYYMIFGGVPYYWTFIKRGFSLSQNVDATLFAEDAPLKDEFRYLYASIFRKPDDYLKIVHALAVKKCGMTRDDIINTAGLTNSGQLTKELEELESCGFIRHYNAFGMQKKGTFYQLMDAFTLFHYQFLDPYPSDEHFWSNQINTPAISAWSGYSFERVCLQHIGQIKQKLGISGVLTEENAWSCKADADLGLRGSQIDLLIVRRDQVINLCEMKYTDTEYTVTAKMEMDIRHKISDLITGTGTRYAVHPTLITTYGMTWNASAGIFQAVVTMDDLFMVDRFA